jgi:molybdopterin-guanine dinucleotide biosynthesis protein MobB
MHRIHVIGRKNHGKTLLVEELVRHFADRGLRVGTVKHTHHQHELDAPGKDLHRHRLAGAAAVGILARDMAAIFRPGARADDEARRYACFAAAMAGCDLVIVEGDSQTRAARVEVWRAAVGSAPLAASDAGIAAVISDDHEALRPWDLSQPVWPRSALDGWAERLRALAAPAGGG